MSGKRQYITNWSHMNMHEFYMCTVYTAILQLLLTWRRQADFATFSIDAYGIIAVGGRADDVFTLSNGRLVLGREKYCDERDAELGPVKLRGASHFHSFNHSCKINVITSSTYQI